MSTDQVIDPFSPHSLMSIGLAALRSVLMAATLASGGAYLAWQGVMTPTFTKGLSSVSMQLTIPALLFSTVLPSVDFRLITSAWPLLLMPAVYVLVGCAIGVVVVAVYQCKGVDALDRLLDGLVRARRQEQFGLGLGPGLGLGRRRRGAVF